SRRRPTFQELISPSESLDFRRRRRDKCPKQTRGRSRPESLKRRFISWYHRCRVISMHVAKNHPWAGIVAPESSNFTLSRQE
ncbi:unnamed protein product, partial [Pylaiella littoralis]